MPSSAHDTTPRPGRETARHHVALAERALADARVALERRVADAGDDGARGIARNELRRAEHAHALLNELRGLLDGGGT